jgi:carbonic anhydrase/acetyltransferase-like protein (isoleucine patch superfamily)
MPLFELDGIRPLLPADGDCFVAPTAVLIGKVILRRAASVWFGAVLRGDNEAIEIGEEANVQDNCVLHTDPGFPLALGARATVGHLAMLHGCTVGEGALIGINATVLNGARIGRNAIVGANALVAEGKVIPDNSLALGAPARVVKEYSEGEVARFAAFAEAYVRRQERYRRGLRSAG